MAEPFLSEIRIMSFGFAPVGWAFCNGQLLPISQNQALFAILGTMYGGNGTTNFALPNLQGRVPIHMSTSGFPEGQTGGSASVTLLSNQIGHGHPVKASGTATASTAAGNFPAPSSAGDAYGGSLDTAMNPAIVSTVGGNQPHNNLQPYLVLTYCIALQGIFPSRN